MSKLVIGNDQGKILADNSLVLTKTPRDWTPSDISTVVWYDASDISTINEDNTPGFVSQWDDKSGNSNHAKQSSGFNQPDTGIATIGGLNAIQFKLANDEYLDVLNNGTINFDGDGGLSFFSVLHKRAYVDQGSGVNALIFKGAALSSSASYGLRTTSGNNLYTHGGVDYNKGAASIIGQDILSSFVSEVGAQHESWENGASIGVDNTGTGLSDNSYDLRIGGDPTSTTRFADVDFGEIIIIAGPVSTETRQKIEGYLAWKWGLQGNLPTDHPYKGSAPITV